MHPDRLLRVGGLTFGIVAVSLVFLGGCGGGAPADGEQVQDMPATVNIADMYKNQPKVKAPKAPPKYDMPGQ